MTTWNKFSFLVHWPSGELGTTLFRKTSALPAESFRFLGTITYPDISIRWEEVQPAKDNNGAMASITIWYAAACHHQGQVQTAVLRWLAAIFHLFRTWTPPEPWGMQVKWWLTPLTLDTNLSRHYPPAGSSGPSGPKPHTTWSWPHQLGLRLPLTKTKVYWLSVLVSDSLIFFVSDFLSFLTPEKPREKQLIRACRFHNTLLYNEQ